MDAIFPKADLGICRCPTCGQATSTELSWSAEARVFRGNGATVCFTPTEARIFDAIWHKRGGSREEMARHVYAGDPDGGPEYLSTLSALLCRMRLRMAGSGYTITRNAANTGAGWRVVREEA